MQAYSPHFVNYMRRAQEPWFWKLPELCKTSDLTQTLWHRPISETCNNALDSLLPVSNRCSSVSVGSFLKFSLCWRKMLMYGLSSLLLLTFPFILGVLAQIFLEKLFPSHSVLSLKFVDSVSDQKRDLCAWNILSLHPIGLMKRCYLSLQTSPACLLREQMQAIMRATHSWFNLEALTEKIALTVSRHFA